MNWRIILWCNWHRNNPTQRLVLLFIRYIYNIHINFKSEMNNTSVGTERLTTVPFTKRNALLTWKVCLTLRASSEMLHFVADRAGENGTVRKEGLSKTDFHCWQHHHPNWLPRCATQKRLCPAQFVQAKIKLLSSAKSSSSNLKARTKETTSQMFYNTPTKPVVVSGFVAIWFYQL